jgi:hypothetical protein
MFWLIVVAAGTVILLFLSQHRKLSTTDDDEKELDHCIRKRIQATEKLLLLNHFEAGLCFYNVEKEKDRTMYSVFQPCLVCLPREKLRPCYVEAVGDYFHIGKYNIHQRCLATFLTPFLKERFLLLHRCQLPADILHQIIHWMNRCCGEKQLKK